MKLHPLSSRKNIRFPGVFDSPMVFGAIVLLAISSSAHAQQFVVTGFEASGSATTRATVVASCGGDTDSSANFLPPGLPPITTMPMFGNPTQTWSQFLGMGANARAGRIKCWYPCFDGNPAAVSITSHATAWSDNWIAVGGDGSGNLRLVGNADLVANFVDDTGASSASAQGNFEGIVTFIIDGVSPGTNVSVYYRADTTNSATGSIVVPGSIDPNQTGQDDVMTLVAGQPYTFAVTINDTARVPFNTRCSNYLCDSLRCKDGNARWVRADVELSFVPLPPPPPPPQGTAVLLFSLDIGSAEEASMGGPFDPGDLYPQGFSAGLNASFYRDDAVLFSGIDPAPNPADPTTGAPVASGDNIADIRDLYFNINGAAFLPFNLATELAGTEPPDRFFPYGYFEGVNNACIPPASRLLVSFDDDSIFPFTADPMAGPMGGAPTNSLSPLTGEVFGRTSYRDEVLQLQTWNAPGTLPLSVERQFSEGQIDGDLLPNPSIQLLEDDNDINALAQVLVDAENASCADFYYFTVDAEARYGLNPGIIYVANSTGILGEAITPADLGVPWGVDINAFDFAWVNNPELETMNFALLFSVASQKVGLPEDESGGLDPNQIYVSFLDGTHEPFLGAPLDNDVDAIAVIRTPYESAPMVATLELPDGKEGSLYDEFLEASGGANGWFDWSLSSGPLPTGLTLNSSGRIQGVPAAGTAGNYSIEVAVLSLTGVATQQLNLVINPPAPPPSFLSSFITPGKEGDWYTFTPLVIDGCTPLIFTISDGALPSGLLLDTSLGRIFGTPLESGSFPFDVTVTDNSGRDASESFVLTIDPLIPGLSPTITTTSVPTFTVGSPANFTFQASGGTLPYFWEVVFYSALPDGLTLDPNGNLSGTPTTVTQVIEVPIFVWDDNFESDTRTFYITVKPTAPTGPTPPLFDPVSTLTGDTGSFFNETLTVSGGAPPLRFRLGGGKLPVGVGLNPSTGTLSGWPQQAGLVTAVVVVEDANDDFDVVVVDIDVTSPATTGYPAWKVSHSVIADGVSQDGDVYAPMVEYYIGRNPNVYDPPGLIEFLPAPNGMYRFIVPFAGVPDVAFDIEAYNHATAQWERVSSNPFPAQSPFMARLRFFEY